MKKHNTILEVTEKLLIVNPGKCCWECQHIYFQQAEPNYSELTPGTGFSLSCNNVPRYWELDTYNDHEVTMGRYLRLAERCPDFKPKGD